MFPENARDFELIHFVMLWAGTVALLTPAAHWFSVMCHEACISEIARGDAEDLPLIAMLGPGEIDRFRQEFGSPESRAGTRPTWGRSCVEMLIITTVAWMIPLLMWAGS